MHIVVIASLVLLYFTVGLLIAIIVWEDDLRIVAGIIGLWPLMVLVITGALLIAVIRIFLNDFKLKLSVPKCRK